MGINPLNMSARLDQLVTQFSSVLELQVDILKDLLAQDQNLNKRLLKLEAESERSHEPSLRDTVQAQKDAAKAVRDSANNVSGIAQPTYWAEFAQSLEDRGWRYVGGK